MTGKVYNSIGCADAMVADGYAAEHRPMDAGENFGRNGVTESIYSGKTAIIPLADVQHIEVGNPLGLVVVTKHTRWDAEAGCWANSIWIDGAEAADFKAAWCRYRSELEAISPGARAP